MQRIEMESWEEVLQNEVRGHLAQLVSDADLVELDLHSLKLLKARCLEDWTTQGDDLLEWFHEKFKSEGTKVVLERFKVFQKEVENRGKSWG